MIKKSALVTGASRRIGAHIAKHLGAQGYHIFLHANRSLEAASHVVDDIVQSGGSAQLVTADFMNEPDIERLMQTVLSHEAQLAIAVNNASYFEYDFPQQANIEILKKSIAAHIYGPYLIFESLKHRPSGQQIDVINMLDQKLENMNPDYYSYTVGKFSLYGLTKIWQAAHLPNIRTFGILLGLTLESGEQSEKNYDRSRRNNPLGRAPMLHEITDLIDFFVSHKFLPGQTIALDGGESIVPRSRDVAFDKTLHQGNVHES